MYSDQPAEAFLSSMEKDLRGGGAADGSRSSRSRRDDRDYDRSDRPSRRTHDDDSSRYRSSRRDRDDDRDRRDDADRGYRRRRDRDEDAADHYRSSRRRRDDDDDYYSSSRRNSSRLDEDYYRSSRSSRRYEDPYGGRGGFGADPYYDDYSRRGPPRSGGASGGGAGSWRDGPGDAGPATVRSPTPEGTRPISERKRHNSKWGIAAEGFQGVGAAQAKSTGLFGIPGQSRTLGVQGAPTHRDGGASGGNAPEQLPPLRFDGNSLSAAATGGAPQVGSGMNSNNRQSRRLYVGNVGYGISESVFVQFWNERLKEMKFAIAEGDPCVSAQVNSDKGYAFVEFRCPEEATNAMSFDGVIYQNQALKIRRPKDYVGPDVGPPPQLHVPGVISTNVPDGPNKIYIGGLPNYLNEDQVIELLKAFGEVRAFNLVREANNGPSKGFAFCEYVDHSLTDLACQGLNDMELGDRKLVVQRASAGQRMGQQGGGGGLGATGANAGALGSRGGGLPLPAGGEGAGDPTQCMTMLNMVTPQELVDDVEYGEIVEDIREECAKYGHVADVRIPRPVAQSKGSSAQAWKQTADAEAKTESGEQKEREGVGRVYVRFAEVQQCEEALRAIAGRQFGGRTVVAAFLREEDWPGQEDGGEDAEKTAAQQSNASVAV